MAVLKGIWFNGLSAYTNRLQLIQAMTTLMWVYLTRREHRCGAQIFFMDAKNRYPA
jgi:hypothetical protein